jgi:hypothetical protein
MKDLRISRSIQFCPGIQSQDCISVKVLRSSSSQRRVLGQGTILKKVWVLVVGL